MVHHRRCIVLYRAVAEIPAAVGNAETGCRIGGRTGERDAFPRADLQRLHRAMVGHRGGPLTGLVTGDGGRKDAGSRVVGPEHDGQAAGGIARTGGNDLALQPRARPCAQYRGGRPIPVVNGHVIHRGRTRRAQGEGDEVERDGPTGLVRADRIGDVLVVAVARGTFATAVQQGPRAGRFRAVEEDVGLAHQDDARMGRNGQGQRHAAEPRDAGGGGSTVRNNHRVANNSAFAARWAVKYG